MNTHTQLVIRRPDDFHVHLRQGEMLKGVLPYTARDFARATVMPNTKPGIYEAEGVESYRAEIKSLAAEWDFEPLMTIKVTEATTAKMIFAAYEAGAVAGKIYPRGKTTNAEDGVRDYKQLMHVYAAMRECGMLLLLHGESPEPRIISLNREARFMDTLRWIAGNFRGLRIVLEHVSSWQGVNTVLSLDENVAATITVHHLLLTHDDVVDEKIRPHHHCMPTPKFYEDRDALVNVVLDGEPKFFLGTDSAPHTLHTKECAEGCSGVFTAPVALAVLAEFFEKHNALRLMESFVSEYGAIHYGLPPNKGTVTLVKRPWVVPQTIAGVVPFKAGEMLVWDTEYED